MRRQLASRIDKFRVTRGKFASPLGSGGNGLFIIPHKSGATLKAIASDGNYWPMDGEPWEHVSVSTKGRCPTWEEMDFIRGLFWGDDETVMQLHVPREDHINNSEFCLHLWRPKQTAIPRPPSLCVGLPSDHPALERI